MRVESWVLRASRARATSERDASSTNALAINSGVTGIGGFRVFAESRGDASSRPCEITVSVVPLPPALMVAEDCRNSIATRPITLEPRLEVDVEPPLLLRI